ncbi:MULTISPECIES: NAD(P)/FAD-dependent oxidoreductase [unclassified Modestobacter]|uniref:NAD(P)/FAD-dependent oxidoreductase n=1 Tax=unclassified Modestobacter TaxID=2643866 RepID=UPI0022AB1C14|nr:MULTISPECIES: FAD-dependent oxidoreductase [unclassified Modestobacter]MCZ2824611.1 FAD-dependent oxidoreductase [Modestobacter sp. VKM Ac-2981]MCZ2853861.1 FAD-dependent oxidoreductase [Modestobacter sp. VKM Ac-2982]
MTPVPADGHVVIVGGSIAAATAARSLRNRGHAGRVTLISSEDHPPYARPPLSKAVLTGTDVPESAYLPELEGVELLLGVPAVGLDPAARTVALADGREVGYDGLVIATGARARTLPGGGDRVYTLRDLGDAQELGQLMRQGARLLVVGGGPLGMEVASVGRELGTEVTLVSDTPPMEALLGAHLGGLLVEAATAAGVEIVRQPVSEMQQDQAGRPVAVLADGRRVDGDVAFVAIGCQPNVEWLAGSGLAAGPRGLEVDEYLRVAPGIVAAGDVVAFPAESGCRRTPYWQSAFDQAVTAVEVLLGSGDAPHLPRPYFWTEQFGHHVKLVGSVVGDDAPEELPAAAGTVMRWRGSNGAPVGAAGIDCPLSITKLRKLLASA